MRLWSRDFIFLIYSRKPWFRTRAFQAFNPGPKVPAESGTGNPGSRTILDLDNGDVFSLSKKKAGQKKKKKAKADSMTEEEIAEKTEEFLIKEGDFLLVELTGRVKSTGKLIDVTSEEIARKEGVYDEKDIYAPRLVVAGKGWVIKGVDDVLEQMVVGVSKTIIIPPAEAFGEKMPKISRLILSEKCKNT